MYAEEDFLMISGLQHYLFCPRQWALIHIENQWAENLRTVEGELLHKHAHDSSFSEKRGDLLTCRDLRVFSPTLGVSGACDIVEFYADPSGVSLSGRAGSWRPVPVEYKHGHAKQNDCDAVQLCAQAMCLEEMLCCSIPYGFLFYGETRRRLQVEFSIELRDLVRSCLVEMHRLYARRYTPKVKPSKACNACSLKEVCIPRLCGKLSAQRYIQETLKGDTACESF